MALNVTRADVAICISIIALGLSGWQAWDNHRLALLANDATLSIDVDTDPSDRKLGFAVRNVGPGVANIKSVRYYVDGKLVNVITDAIEDAKLNLDRFRETELTPGAMGAAQVVWIARYNARKSDQERAADFFERHLSVAVDYCSAGGRCATECSEVGGCGKPM
jgi:hypothetical protein